MPHDSASPFSSGCSGLKHHPIQAIQALTRPAAERCVLLHAVTSQDSGRQYKTFRGLQADLEPPEYQGRPGRSLHLFLGSNSLTSLSAHRNADGSYSGTLGLKRGGVTHALCDT